MYILSFWDCLIYVFSLEGNNMSRYSYKNTTHYNKYIKRNDSISRYFESTKIPYKETDVIVMSFSDDWVINYCKRIDYQVVQAGKLVDYIYKED